MSECNIYIDRVFADIENRSGMSIYLPKNISSLIDKSKISKWE
jgi:hypothetical protein